MVARWEIFKQRQQQEKERDGWRLKVKKVGAGQSAKPVYTHLLMKILLMFSLGLFEKGNG